MAEPSGFQTQNHPADGMDEAAKAFFEQEQAKREGRAKLREAAGLAGGEAPSGAPAAGSELTDQERIDLASGRPAADDQGAAREDGSGEPIGDPEDQGVEPQGDLEEGEPQGDPYEEEIPLDAQIELADGSTTTLEDLRDGYMRQRDYTAKTTELGEQRRLFEEKVAEAYNAYKQRIDGAVELADQLQAHLAVFAPNAQQMNDLRVRDPGEYAARMEDMRAKKALIDKALAGKRDAEAEAARRAEEARAASVPIERAKLAEKVPAFKKNFDGEYHALTRYALASDGGELRPEEWDLISDHRYVTLVWKAREYDRATRSTLKGVRKKLARRPRSVRSGTQREAGESGGEQLEAAMANLKANPDSRKAQEAAFMARENAKRSRVGAQRGRT